MTVAAGWTWDFKTLLICSIVVVFLAVLGYRLMRRDARIWRARYGFFVERDRYHDDEPEIASEDQNTRDETQLWPRRDDS